jgi:putative ATP-dependent endonuclease of OLD family
MGGKWRMQILSVEINGFRGILHARLVLPLQAALVGSNGSGKSTIVDALSLIFGRHKLVRDLTEHDFTGSYPKPQDRIRIVATLGGFASNDAADHPQWFRYDRAVEKWWNPETCTIEPAPKGTNSMLCAQIGYVARFNHEELAVDQKRYFHDDDDATDPFMDDTVTPFPNRLLYEIGFFVLPARRTWPATISFGSEMFRRAVATLGGVPASSVLAQRDALREPVSRLEEDPQIQPLVTRINERLSQLLPGQPKLQLRLTSTDSDSFLNALVPHYQAEDGVSLPAGRHGTGLLSLQTLVLLLEIGRARTKAGESFILALEEPELHVPPGLQRRLIGEAAMVSNQIICTTHAPRVAAFFDAHSIQILTHVKSHIQSGESQSHCLEGRPLAPSPMIDDPNPLIQLYTDQRARLVEALMFPRVLVPEGRIDFEWLRLLLDVAETGKRPLEVSETSIPPFGSVVGVIPTRDSAVKVTFEKLRSLHPAVFVLLDGDPYGDDCLAKLIACEPPPFALVQWPQNWSIEDVVRWVMAVDEAGLVSEIQKRLSREFANLDEFTVALKDDNGQNRGLKTHYMAHEEIAGAIKGSATCVQRVDLLLEALTRAAIGRHEGFAHIELDLNRSTDRAKVYRFCP